MVAVTLTGPALLILLVVCYVAFVGLVARVIGLGERNRRADGAGEQH